MSGQPPLKLRLSLGSTSGSPATSTPLFPTPIVQTPGGSRPKLKLTNKSVPNTPLAPLAEEVPKPKKTKAGRAPKPSAKVLESRKRANEENEEESTISVVPPPSKKIKVQIKNKSSEIALPTPKTPGVGVHIKAKIKGKPPVHPLGDGYNSDASDAEVDPAIEEQLVLRMLPGDDCDYLRKAIVDKKIGIPINQGGPDIVMKFFHDEGRRALVSIRGKHYAATVVDLPCIIEGMKSWDKRGWWKSADICQMLWVFAPIAKEGEALTIDLPKIIDPNTFQYPHGLTPPMHYARKRRFRKRISRTAIEAVEAAVERLMAEDRKAESSTVEVIDPEAGNRSRGDTGMYSEGEDEDAYGEEDAEGDADDTGYFTQSHNHGQMEVSMEFEEDIEDPDLEADLEAELLKENENVAATPMSGAVYSETPAAVEEEDSGDESDEDGISEEGEEETDVIDDEERARLQKLATDREDVAEMEARLATLEKHLADASNPHLRKKLEGNIRSQKAELQLKKSSMGVDDEDAD